MKKGLKCGLKEDGHVYFIAIEQVQAIRKERAGVSSSTVIQSDSHTEIIQIENKKRRGNIHPRGYTTSKSESEELSNGKEM